MGAFSFIQHIGNICIDFFSPAVLQSGISVGKMAHVRLRMSLMRIGRWRSFSVFNFQVRWGWPLGRLPMPTKLESDYILAWTAADTLYVLSKRELKQQVLWTLLVHNLAIRFWEAWFALEHFSACMPWEAESSWDHTTVIRESSSWLTKYTFLETLFARLGFLVI